MSVDGEPISARFGSGRGVGIFSTFVLQLLLAGIATWIAATRHVSWEVVLPLAVLVLLGLWQVIRQALRLRTQTVATPRPNDLPKRYSKVPGSYPAGRDAEPAEATDTSPSVPQGSAELRLKQMEQRLQTIINLLPYSIFVKTQQGQVILANQEYANFFGLRRRDVLNKYQAQLQPLCEEFAALQAQDRQVFESCQSLRTESWLTAKDGQRRLYRIEKVTAVDPVLDEPVLLGLGIDISDHFRREQLLHARGRVLEGIARTDELNSILTLLISEMEIRVGDIRITILGLQHHHPQSKVLASSPLADAILDYLRVPTDQLPSFMQRSLQLRELTWAVANRQDEHAEPLQRAMIDFELPACWCQPVTDNHGAVIALFIVWSESQLAPDAGAEAELREASLLSALAIQRVTVEIQLRQFNNVFQSSKSGIALLSATGKVEYANPALGELFRLPEAGLLQHDLVRFRPGAEAGKMFDRLIEASKKSLPWQGELSFARSDNSRVTVQASLSPSAEQDGLMVLVLDDISELHQVRQQVQQLIFYDPITGLNNRGLLFERLQQSIDSANRNHQRLALVLLDIDRFKHVNDSLGTDGGDAVLKRIAERLLNTVRKEDIVARIGGNEFAVVLTGFENSAQVRGLVSKIQQAISEPINIAGHSLVLSVTAGIATGPENVPEAKEMLRHVELALYRSKTNGTGTIEFYEFELNRKSQQRFLLEQEMRGGINEQEFFMMYQPIVNAWTGEIVGAEALMRWQNPRRGLVSPVEFIPVAEETGLIRTLGSTALRDALNFISSAGSDAVPIRVNISARQLEDGKLPEQVLKLLRDAQVPTEMFGLELTESLLMDNRRGGLKQLAYLHEQGLSLAIDDFGTGFSSLSYLKTFPVDTLKIDRSFISDLDSEDADSALVDAIIAMSQRLHMKVIAEGVETLEQLNQLKQMGYEQVYIQGYYFSKPLLPEKFLALLRQRYRFSLAS